MIVFKTLKWGNLFSYGDNNSIDFSEASVTQLVGRNGHGKSSIALILELVLYNKNSKGVKKADILNRNINAKFYWIDLTFDKDGNTYNIYTKVASTQSVKLTRNGEDISSHTTTATFKTIQEIVGCDHKTFCQIVYQSNSSSLEFLTATDSSRKAFLVDLFDLTKYTKALEVFKSLLKEANNKLQLVDSKIATIQGWYNKYGKEAKEDVAELLQVPSFEDLTPHISNIKAEISGASTRNKQIIANNSYKTIADDILKKVSSNIHKPSYDINSARENLGSVKSKAVETEKKLTSASTLKKVKTKCDLCGQAIPHDHVPELDYELINSLTEEVAIYKQDRARLESEIAQYEMAYKLWNTNQQLQTEYEKYYALHDKDLPEELVNVTELSSKLQKLEDTLSTHRKVTAEVISKNNAISAKNAKIAVLKQQADSYEVELADLLEEQEIVKKEISDYSILVKTFSPTGLVAYKIECLIQDLEVSINSYLQELSDGRFQIHFIVESDKLNVQVNDNGKLIEIYALSSGELARVNVSALLGIRKILQAVSATRINLLILDETIDRLDTTWREKVVEVLLNEDQLNTVLVSHSFSHPLIHKLHIVKENDISRIENG